MYVTSCLVSSQKKYYDSISLNTCGVVFNYYTTSAINLKRFWLIKTINKIKNNIIKQHVTHPYS